MLTIRTTYEDLPENITVPENAVHKRAEVIIRIECDRIPKTDDVDEGSRPGALVLDDDTFWNPPTLDELAVLQGVSPVCDLRRIFGSWPGELDDGFEDEVDRLRCATHESVSSNE